MTGSPAEPSNNGADALAKACPPRWKDFAEPGSDNHRLPGPIHTLGPRNVGPPLPVLPAGPRWQGGQIRQTTGSYAAATAPHQPPSKPPPESGPIQYPPSIYPRLHVDGTKGLGLDDLHQRLLYQLHNCQKGHHHPKTPFFGFKKGYEGYEIAGAQDLKHI